MLVFVFWCLGFLIFGFWLQWAGVSASGRQLIVTNVCFCKLTLWKVRGGQLRYSLKSYLVSSWRCHIGGDVKREECDEKGFWSQWAGVSASGRQLIVTNVGCRPPPSFSSPKTTLTGSQLKRII